MIQGVVHWDSCRLGADMIAVYDPPGLFKGSYRKLTLLVAANLRQHDSRLADIITEFADGELTDADLENRMMDAWYESAIPVPPLAFGTNAGRRIYARDVCTKYFRRLGMTQLTIANLLRDIIGTSNSIAAQRTFLSQGVAGRTVRDVAGSIYAERRWQDMPVLWDALEDAGCTCPIIRNHCLRLATCQHCFGTEHLERGVTVLQDCPDCIHAGPHVRGCWVVDWILGKA